MKRVALWAALGIFVATTGAPKPFPRTQQLELGAVGGNLLGTAVALHADLLFAGAPGLVGSPTGTVWVFRRSLAGEWEQTEAIATPSSNNEIVKSFGRALLYAPPFLFVSAWNDRTGRIYVYEQKTNGFELKTDFGTSATDDFGRNMCLMDKFLLVTTSEAVLAYQRKGGKWKRLRALPSAGSWELACTDELLAVGAREKVTIFRRTGKRWRLEAELEPPSGASQFGQSVATDGEHVFVGAPNATRGSEGRVYVFAKNTGGGSLSQRKNQWSLEETIRAKDARRGDDFGHDVVVAGTYLVVVDSNADLPDIEGVGAGYVFEQRSDGRWKKRQKISPGNPSLPGEFGGVTGTFPMAVASFGGVLAIGDPFAGGVSPIGQPRLHGAVYIFHE